MAKININYIIGILIIVAVTIAGVTISFQIDKDKITLYRDGQVLGREKWIVNAERTYFNLNSWYNTNVKCPKIEAIGGHRTATRCYYPDDYYEPLSRSLINTKITEDNFVVTKEVPHYAYGTSGSYAGYLTEVLTFEEEVSSEKDFPKNYEVSWEPKDTRNYYMIWRVWDIKDMTLSDGIYHDCVYNFGNLHINLQNDCSKLKEAVVDGDKIEFYFYNERGDQYFNPLFVDPVYIVLSIAGVNNLKLNSSEGTNMTNENLYLSFTPITNNTETSMYANISFVPDYNNNSVDTSYWGYNLVWGWHGDNFTDYVGGKIGTQVNDLPVGNVEGYFGMGTKSCRDCTQSLTFVNDEIYNPHMGDYSVSVWFKYDLVDTSQVIGTRNTASNNIPGWSIRTYNTNFYMVVDDGVSNVGSGKQNLNDNNWHHFVGVIDRTANTLSSYVDSVNTGDVEDISGIGDINTTDLLSLGARNTGTLGFNGTLDEMLIWKGRALTSTEVSQLYNDTKALRQENVVLTNNTYYQAFLDSGNTTINETWIGEIFISNVEGWKNFTSNSLSIMDPSYTSNNVSLSNLMLNSTYGTNGTNEDLYLSFTPIMSPITSSYANISWIPDYDYNSTDTSYLGYNLSFVWHMDNLIESINNYEGTIDEVADLSSDGWLGNGFYSPTTVLSPITFNDNSIMNNLTNKSFTISIWARWEEDYLCLSGATDESRIFNANVNNFQLKCSGGDLKFLINNIATSGTSISYTLPLSQWQKWNQFVVTVNTTSAFLYINGTMVAIDPDSTLIKTYIDSSLTVGAKVTNLDNFTGTLDELMMWERVLNPDEVLELYNIQKALRIENVELTNNTYYQAFLDSGNTTVNESWRGGIIIEDYEETHNFTSDSLKVKSETTQGVQISLTLSGLLQNVFAELGSIILVNTSINDLGQVCVDINHHEYGTNYSCSVGQNNLLFNFNVTNFRKNVNNESEETFNLSFIDGQLNQTFYISAHQWDIIDNLTINITGFSSNGTVPNNIKIYINNTLSNDVGTITNSSDYKILEFWDGNESKTYVWDYVPWIDNSEVKTAGYFKVPGSVILHSARMNLTGYFNNNTIYPFGLLNYNWTGYLNGTWGNVIIGEKGNLTLSVGNSKGSFYSIGLSEGTASTKWNLTVKTPYNYSISQNWNESGMLYYLQMNESAQAVLNDGMSSTTWAVAGPAPTTATHASPTECVIGNCSIQTAGCGDPGSRWERGTAIDTNLQWADLSIEGWIKANPGDCGVDDICTLYAYTQNDGTNYIRITSDEGSGGLTFAIAIGGVTVVAGGTNMGIRDGMWHHFYVQAGSGTNDVWIDGKKLYDGTDTDFFNHNMDGTVYNYIGNWHTSTGCWLGAIDEFVIRSNKTGSTGYLTEQEIKNHFYSGIGKVNIQTSYSEDNTTWIGYKNFTGNWINGNITNQARYVKFDVLMEALNSTYPPHLNYVNITKENAIIPSDTYLEVGSIDGIREWNYTGLFNHTDNRTNNFASSINTYLDICDLDDNGYCNVPFYLYSKTAGSIRAYDISLNYTTQINPIQLNTDLIMYFLRNETNYTQVPITITSSRNGTLSIEDIRFDYAGGNKTYEVLAHNSDYTINKTYNATLFFSNWDYHFPNNIYWMEFIPSTPKSKNVSAYGQTSTKPIFNITTYNYGGKDMNISIMLNETMSCVNLTYSMDSEKNNGTLMMNNTWYEFAYNKPYQSNLGIWLWTDYNCSYSTWNLFEPEIHIVGCCAGCICDKE